MGDFEQPHLGYFKAGEGIPEGQHHEEIHRPFDKARCHQLSVRGARNKTATVRNQRNPDKQISKACRDFTDIEHNPGMGEILLQWPGH